MVSRDPFSVVGGSGGDSRAVNRGFGLGGARGLFRALWLGGLALLGEVWCNPNGIEEVCNATKASKEEEVKEDTNKKKND